MSNQREPASAGCLIMVVIVVAVIWNWDDISSKFSKVFHDEIQSVKKAMADCDDLREEIHITQRCMSSANCMLTKDELIQDDENVRDWFHYCSDEHGDP